jgi:hypothetical protein
VGPPGVGKTSLAQAAANEYGFQVVELNASDVRTEKAIENALIPASTSLTLDSFSSNGHGNLILLDEVDGVFGREDRGGLASIISVIKDPPVPVVMTANNIDDDRFDELRKGRMVIELHELRPRYLVLLVNHILRQEGVRLPAKTVETIARRSAGDIRSAINDAQAAAAGTFDDKEPRIRSLNELETLRRLFGTQHFREARRALNETEIPLYKDELILLLHDLIPYIYTQPPKLATAYDALSRADIAYARIGVNRSRGIAPPPFNMPRHDSVPQWSLLPVALNELASVGGDPTDNDIDHAFEMAPRVSQKTIERYQYHLWSIDHACTRLARTYHCSKRTTLRDVLPFLIALLQVNEESGRETATAMELEERDIEFLISEAKTTDSPAATKAETLDPTDFKLPYMGKDKFIQLMRTGIKYDSASRTFSVRRMDNLDAVEENVSRIIAKPVKFIRSKAAHPQVLAGKITKICYVDGTEISCESCEFVEDCPTHVLADIKSCICIQTISDPQGYGNYVSKNESAAELTAKPRKKSSPRKKATRG